MLTDDRWYPYVCMFYQRNSAHHGLITFLLTLYNLHADFFIGNRKNMIPSHWHETGSWNPSLCKARTSLYLVSVKVADVPFVARASATMILTVLNRNNLVSTREGLSQSYLISTIMNIYLCLIFNLALPWHTTFNNDERYSTLCGQ